MKKSVKNLLGHGKDILVSRGKDIIVILVIILVFSLILEQIVRFHLYGMDSFSYTKMKSMAPIGHSGYIKESSIPEVLFELKPNLDTYYKFARFKTNSHGLRDKEYTLEKPPNTFRVAVIGGSFTMASGVEIDDAYHTLLENRLNKEFPDLNYEFINFGVAGYMINHKLATLKFRVFDYEPDLILFILDSSRFLPHKETRKFVLQPTRNQFFKSFTYKLILTSKLLEFKYYKQRYEELISHFKSLKNFDKILQEISQISGNYQIPICIVVLDYEYWHYELLSEKIESLVEKNNLCYSNTLPSFENTDDLDMVIFKNDFHPNTKAHRIFTDVIYNDLKAQSLLNK